MEDMKMKYENLIEEFGLDRDALNAISNDIAVKVIDGMFDVYNFNDYELEVLVKAVGMFEA